MKKTVDRSKKSNIKCWNCKYWIREERLCGNPRSLKLFREYYHRCQKFEWKEGDEK